ncbi:MAG: putative rane protein, partial [Verrucomicrobiota bacterium]
MRILRGERWLIALLCFVGALRTFLYAAAFPFFSNGDEDLHFDVIVRYSEGRVPRNFDVLSNDALNLISLYASPEFIQTPDQFQNGKFPTPLWKQPPVEAEPVIEATKAGWSSEINWEVSQPPLYYALAAFWWKTGQLFGLNGIQSLYWIRLLNALLVAILVAIGFVAGRTVAPGSVSLRVGTALVLAFIPQDAFYVMTNDVLSPVCFGIVFFCVLRWFSKPPTFYLGAITGLAIAATFLTKLSNLPLITIAAGTILAHCLLPMHRSDRSTIVAFVLMTLCAGIPILSWMLWSHANFGDITGSTTKMALLDWTRKPFSEWLHHPIFSFRGLWIFWSELIARFWRGELMWHNRELHCSLVDDFFAISSLIFIAIALCSIRPSQLRSNLQLKVILFAAICFIAAISFFFLLSIEFDFGRCIFPSRNHPYFTSGR